MTALHPCFLGDIEMKMEVLGGKVEPPKVPAAAGSHPAPLEGLLLWLHPASLAEVPLFPSSLSQGSCAGLWEQLNLACGAKESSHPYWNSDNFSPKCSSLSTGITEAVTQSALQSWILTGA